jgi:hypothetical protein
MGGQKAGETVAAPTPSPSKPLFLRRYFQNKQRGMSGFSRLTYVLIGKQYPLILP